MRYDGLVSQKRGMLTCAYLYIYFSTTAASRSINNKPSEIIPMAHEAAAAANQPQAVAVQDLS